MALDYKALRAATPQRGKRDHATAEARKKERNGRAGVAQSRALRMLAKAHPDDYRTLYEAAKAEVDAERGPLPGDE